MGCRPSVSPASGPSAYACLVGTISSSSCSSRCRWKARDASQAHRERTCGMSWRSAMTIWMLCRRLGLRTSCAQWRHTNAKTASLCARGMERAGGGQHSTSQPRRPAAAETIGDALEPRGPYDCPGSLTCPAEAHVRISAAFVREGRVALCPLRESSSGTGGLHGSVIIVEAEVKQPGESGRGDNRPGLELIQGAGNRRNAWRHPSSAFQCCEQLRQLTITLQQPRRLQLNGRTGWRIDQMLEVATNRSMH